MKLLTTIVAASLFIAACSQKTAVQGNETRSGKVAEMIESRNYVFKAVTALPARGRSIPLNSSNYTLRVNKDSVIAELPFFGWAYTAPIGQTDGGIRFISRDFVYNKNIRKNGSYEIEIVPRDRNEVQRLFLTVSPSGYGSLYVNSNQRQSISFNGQLDNNVR